MTSNIIPQKRDIDKYAFYEVHKLGWFFENNNDAIENNSSIQEDIAKDFSEKTGIDYETVIKTFNVDYIYTRSTEPILLLYTNNDSEEVHYTFVDLNTSIYRELNSLSI